jgi:hypothetical protein
MTTKIALFWASTIYAHEIFTGVSLAG